VRPAMAGPGSDGLARTFRLPVFRPCLPVFCPSRPVSCATGWPVRHCDGLGPHPQPPLPSLGEGRRDVLRGKSHSMKEFKESSQGAASGLGRGAARACEGGGHGGRVRGWGEDVEGPGGAADERGHAEHVSERDSDVSICSYSRALFARE
jgi:hypothetical protein